MNTKILYYMRHSFKGADGNLSDEGVNLAVRQGVNLSEVAFSQSFVGPLPRTQQTADSFFAGYKGPFCARTLMKEIGTDDLFPQITTDAFKKAVEAGSSHLDALLSVHGYEQVADWVDLAQLGLLKMFLRMKEGETAIAFGHSPLVELAAYTVNNRKLAPELRRLPEMAGFKFVSSDGVIDLKDVIDPPPPR